MTTTLPFAVPSKYSFYSFNNSLRLNQPDFFVIGSDIFFPQSMKGSAHGPIYKSSNGKDFASISYPAPFWDGVADSCDMIYFGGYVYQYAYIADSQAFCYRRTADFVTWSADDYIVYNADGFDLIFNPMSFGVVLGGRQYRFLDVGSTSPLLMTYTDDGHTILGEFVPAGGGYREHYIEIQTVGLVGNKACKIVAYGGYLYSIPYNYSTVPANSVSRSSDGITWDVVTADWGLPISPVIDCVVTSEGLLVVLQNKQTWVSVDGATWTMKNYTLPDGSLNNGRIVPLGTDLFFVGCGSSRNTVFKLVTNSGPVGVPI